MSAAPLLLNSFELQDALEDGWSNELKKRRQRQAAAAEARLLRMNRPATQSCPSPPVSESSESDGSSTSSPTSKAGCAAEARLLKTLSASRGNNAQKRTVSPKLAAESVLLANLTNIAAWD